MSVLTFAGFLTSLFILAIMIGLGSLPVIITRYRLALQKDKFRCTMCGNCCRFHVIDLSKEDIKRIESHAHQDFWERTKAGGYKFKQVHGKCSFLKDDKCSIHKYRAQLCRDFPFFKLYGFLPYARVWGSCPGMQNLRKETGI